jgi:small-conductance mechanosensitive channel
MTLNPSKQSSEDTSVTSWEKSVKNILFALLVCSLIFLGEKALVQLISISYHRKQFDAKIKQSKHNVYLVGLLFEASRNMFPMYCPEFKDEDAIIFDSLLAQSNGKHTKRSSIMPLRMMQQVGRQVGHNVGRIGDKVTAAFGNVASELTGKQVFNPQATHSIVIEALERKRCAAALARRIWMSFVVEGRDALFLEDIVEVLGPDHEADAEECFAALDKDGNGDVSLDEMILTISEFGRMRKSLNHSMHDVDQAIHVLDNLLLSVAFVVGVLVFVSFVTTGFGTVIAAGATSLLSLSFVFSTTAQEVLGSCIFLFVKHPFDIGDRVDISDKSYVVERISLLFSVFRTVGDHRMTQVPNNILNSLWIDNFTRANAMHEQLTVPVSFDTSFAEIQALREEMEIFVRDPANSRDFQSDFNIEVVGVGDMDKLELRVDIRHKSNWSNETVRAARRSKFMCALVLAMRKVPIRAPGAAAPEEESKDDGDDKSDGAPHAGDNKSTQAGGAAAADSKRDGSGQVGGLTPAAAAAAAGMMNYDAQTTGFEQNRSSGSVTHRGSTAVSQREAAIADRLNARSPVVPAVDPGRDANDGLYRTTTNTSNQGNQLSVYDGNTGGIARGLSTGHRKAGARASYHDEDAQMPPRLSPVAAGMTPSHSGVPILNTPAPPGSRGSTRYEPPTTHAPTSQPGAHPIGSFAQSYYGHEGTYDSVPLNGITPDRATASSSHYDMPDRYDPASPPSIYSPQPQAPAPTLRKGRTDSPYGGHEA